MPTAGTSIELTGWLLVAIAGSVMVTQAFGWYGGRSVAIVQSLTPYLLLAMVPLAIAAAIARSPVLGATASAVVVGGLALARPLLVGAPQPEPADGSAVRAGAVNLFYGNTQVGTVAAALADLDLDLVVFSEYTPDHQFALLASPLTSTMAHRVDQPGPHAAGTAVWSKHPLCVHDPPATTNATIDLTVDAPGGSVRVVAVHPTTPMMDFDGWLNDLETIGEVGREGSTPTLVIGDFNASFWHPSFRALLASGYNDAHIAVGKGRSSSWPTDKWIPPFVRLDRALTNAHLVATAVDDFDVPGSDHRGFVVTVAMTPRV